MRVMMLLVSGTVMLLPGLIWVLLGDEVFTRCFGLLFTILAVVNLVLGFKGDGDA